MSKEFNTDLIVFTKPQKEDTYYRSRMTLGPQDPVILQTPPLTLVSRDGTLVEFALSDKGAKSLRFYEQVARIDDLALRTLGTQSESWFQKKIPMDKLKTMYQPCVSPTQIPTVNHLRFRLAKNLRIFRDSPQDEISFDELTSLGCKVSCILRFEGILIAGGRARLDIRVAQLLTIRPKEEPPAEPKPKVPEDGYDSDAACTFDPIPVAEPPTEPPVAVPAEVPAEPPVVVPTEPPAEAPVEVPAEVAKRLRAELADLVASGGDLDAIGDLVARIRAIIL
jgi:hypothetical protein